VRRAFAFGAFVTLALFTRDAAAADASLYAKILAEHTLAVTDIASTRVDYGALRRSKDWADLVASLRAADPSRRRAGNETKAFWINAYNILAIDLVQRGYPTDSIRSLGGLLAPVWKKRAGEIGGRAYTLDEIEHEILRPMGDPRVHGAIVCASLSCPPLRREPYRADELDAQLEDNLRRWLADPRKGAYIDRATQTLYLSPIFDWFAGDFDGGVVTFVAAHGPSGSAAWIRAQGGALRVRYLDYDWHLNDTATAPK
jgi:hypothetical protein